MEDGEDEEIEARFSRIVADARALQTISAPNSSNSEQYLRSARSILLQFDLNPIAQTSQMLPDQMLVVSVLQKLAYHDPDSGGVQDIAEWCISQWLRLLQSDDHNAEALQGLGQAWLWRAQRALARIHQDEGSSSSSGQSGSRPGTSQSISYTASDEARDAARAVAEADARVATADYVEARGILLPSTEYYVRAIEAAEQRGQMSGCLLASAAEAYMSLGNVSYSYVNEQYFRQALLYLRRASEVPRYTLSPFLQRYLDDYGRLLL